MDKKKKILLALFILFCILQLSVPIYMIIKVYLTKLESEEFHFQCSAYDPYNPLQGRYVRLAFEQETKYISALSSLKNMNMKKLEELKDQEVYCILDKENKIANIKDITQKKPGLGSVYFKAKVSSINYSDDKNNRQIRVKFPFDKYFIQENIAAIADKILRDTEKKYYYNPILVVDVGRDEKYVVKSLLINDHPIDYYIKNFYNENQED